jgi:hypothetical protein
MKKMVTLMVVVAGLACFSLRGDSRDFGMAVNAAIQSQSSNQRITALGFSLPLYSVPDPMTVLAGTVLLLPFGLASLRVLWKSRLALR